MDSTSSSVFIPIDLGPAAAFDQNIFPLAYFEAEGNFNKGVVLIRATLEEMEKIRDLGIDLNQNDEFIYNTRVKVEGLREQMAKLQPGQSKNRFPNPFKAFRNYRALRLFFTASRSVFLHTKRTSEKIHREVTEAARVIPTTQLRMADGLPVPPGALTHGFVIDLPDGYTDYAKQTINGAMQTIITADPFQDNSRIPQRGEDEQAISLAATESILSQDADGSGGVIENQTSIASSVLRSRPTSPPVIENHYYIHNSIVASHSNITAPTVSQGPRATGASVTQFTS